MNYFILFFLFFGGILSNLHSDEPTTIQELSAPLMDFDRGPHIGLSPENRRTLLEDPIKQEIEIANNLAIYESKTFPLLGAILALAILSGIFLLAIFWEDTKKWAHKHFIKEKTPRERFKDRLNELAKLYKKKISNETSTLIQLSNLTRSYLQENYSIPALELTTPELTTLLSKKFPSQSYYTHLFERADLAKFGNLTPTPEEIEKFLKEVMSKSNE